MTDQEINIAIAKYEISRGAEIAYRRDYCNDLNEMHEVEPYLGSSQQVRYLKELGFIPTLKHGWVLCRATAHQRAEAFLRTIGKWKDEAKVKGEK